MALTGAERQGRSLPAAAEAAQPTDLNILGLAVLNILRRTGMFETYNEADLAQLMCIAFGREKGVAIIRELLRLIDEEKMGVH